MPLSPITIYDSFTRNIGWGTWGTGDSGHAWTYTWSQHSVNGTAGLISVPAHSHWGASHINLPAHNIPSQASAEVLMRVRYTGAAAYPLTDFGPMLSRTTDTKFYAAVLQGNWSEIAIIIYLNGVRYEMNRTSKSLVKNKWYWVRFRRDNSGLRLKVWDDGSFEPTNWTLTTGLWSGSAPPGAGNAGVFFRGTNSAHTINVDTYYFYTLEDEHAPIPVVDEFERTVDTGWGWSDSGHIWEGHFSQDPAIRFNAPVGRVVNAEDGYAEYQVNSTTGRYGFLGPSRSGNIETLTTFSINSTLGNTHFWVGARGMLSASGGNANVTGYALYIPSGSSTFQLYKKTSFAGSWTLVGSSGFATTLTTGKFHVRYQIIGTLHRARIWAEGTSEPGTWQLSETDSSISSGRLFLGVSQSDTTLRSVKIYRAQYSVPPPVTDEHVETGNVTLMGVGDTTLNMRATYTKDTNNNSSIIVRYKPTTDSGWTTFGGNITVSRANKRFDFLLTGLTPSTAYHISVEYTDPDGVIGSNPRTVIHSTSANSVTTGTLSVTDVGSDFIDVVATYSNDGNNNSVAILQTRSMSAVSLVAQDHFISPNGTDILNHTPTLGNKWLKPSYGVPAQEGTRGVIFQNRLSIERGPTQQNVCPLVSPNPSPTTEYDVEADLHIAGLRGRHGVTARTSWTNDTGYVFRYSADVRQWQLARVVNSTFTVLAYLDAEVEVGQTYKIRLSVRDAYKAAYVDGVEILRSTDNTVTGTGYGGIRLVASLGDITPTNQLVVNNFTMSYRTVTGSWVSHGALTADRDNKRFTGSATGLTSDIVYEVRVTFSDTNGVFGINPLILTVMTFGKAIALNVVGATTQPTSAIIDVFYLYDTNNNSQVGIQYRSTMDFMWTTVPITGIIVDREFKKFSTTVVGLQPSTTYEVRVIAEDPDGVVEGFPSQLSGLFTTHGVEPIADPMEKTYLWKVYDLDGNYIDTWDDAGIPEYAWYENGGVTSLGVTLARPITTINAEDRTIAQQNQVDIWALDPSSIGMGPNLLLDRDMDADMGAWTLGVGASYDEEGGPDGTSALRFHHENTDEHETLSENVEVRSVVPFVLQATARGRGSKLQMYAAAYDIEGNKLDQSDDTAETVGPDWQNLRIEYTPPVGTAYVRMIFRNRGVGTMWADKAIIRPKEMLVYRGRIESYTPKVDQSGETIDIQILGLVSQLSDDYIEFLQFVAVQPARDQQAGRPNYGPADPADILRMIIDIAQNQNPRFQMYYTADSIQNTGQIMEYTFRDQPIRDCFDKTRNLCPADWHYFIEPDGRVHLRGPNHVDTHLLRLGVEILNFSVENSIRNLKNFIRVKGRQDEAETQPDGHGSINYVTFDQESIDKYGKRMLFIRDAQITTPDTAELVGQGRLEELNREEQRAQAYIPDEKLQGCLCAFSGRSLRGYNIEALRPGDRVLILDPVGGPRNTYWDQFEWDKDSWDFSNVFAPMPEAVPIKNIQFFGDHALLELSERQPSQVGAYNRLHRYLQTQNRED